MSEPIVVGTDGSGESDLAVRWAAAEASLRERPLRIVHVVKRWPYKAPLFAPPEKARRLTEAGETLLDAAQKRVVEEWPDLETTTALVAEDTSDGLLEQVAGAFELVLGSRGRGGFASLLLGSTSLRLAARSPVPVVIVRGDMAAGGDVVVGIDLPVDDHDALGYAFDAAARRGARLRVLHAWELSPTLIDAGYTAQESEVGHQLREEVVAACGPLRSRYPRVEIVAQVVLGHPVKALYNASRGARLLVAGAHQRRWKAPLLGSISHGIIHHARCPVAIVPPG